MGMDFPKTLWLLLFKMLFHYPKYFYKIVAEIVGKIFYCFVHNTVDVMGCAVIKHIPAICYIR